MASLMFYSVRSEISKHYNQKAALEQELPTVTQKLSTTTECLVGSLGLLTSVTGKVLPTGVTQHPGYDYCERCAFSVLLNFK